MPRKEGEPLQGHHILLYKGDYQRLQDAYDNAKAGQVIRKLVRKFINEALEANAPTGGVEISFEE
jgi:hypothetical protein